MSVTDFISAAVEEKPVAALKAFSDAIQSKVDVALQTKYDEVASSVFNAPQEFESEMEDNDHE